MRFHYSPETGEFAIFANEDEFDIKSAKLNDDKEYKVISRQLKLKNGEPDENAICKFIKLYSKFINDILKDLNPEHEIKDILILSIMPKLGYSWRSLSNITQGKASTNFLDLILTYGLWKIIEADNKENSQFTKQLMEILSERDFAKLTLAKILLNTITHPNVWKHKQKPDKTLAFAETRIKSLKVKLAKFEKKYGFASEDMEKYYKDDKYPEKEMTNWLEIYKEYEIYKLTVEKYNLVEKLTDEFANSSIES